MKLQTVLIINSLTSLLLVIVWVPLSNVARENFNVALQAQVDSKDMLQDFIELNELTRELSLNAAQQTITDWRRKYDVATIRLIPQYFQGSTEGLVLDSLKKKTDLLKSKFEDFVASIDGLDPTTDTQLRQKLADISEQSHVVLQEILFFNDIKQTGLSTASDAVDIYRSATIVGAFLAITLINFLIYRAISKPISSLTKVASEISRGNVHVKLDKDSLPRFGEFGQLADAFIHMTERLEGLYSSLEQKVAEKTRKLSDSLEEYEEQVIETEKFKHAVDSATDGILIVKVNGQIVYTNSAWTTITGYSPNELVDLNIRVLQSKKQDEQIYSKIWNGMIGLQDVTIAELVNKRKTGDYYQAQIAIYPIKEDDKPIYYVCMQQDITKRKEIEKAKTEFVSLASHQLRTPLSTISWYTEILMSDDAGELNDEQRKLLNEIVESNKHMVDLVNALLNVSRLEMGTFSVLAKWTSLVEICESVIKEMQHQIEERGHHLEKHYDENIPEVKTDPNLMRIVFQNLISNAVKYTPKDGQVGVSIKFDPEGDDVTIVIKDNGMGIPGRQQDQVFDKLFRADNVKQTDTEGTGLGLYLVKAIVEYAHGKISFKSAENEGTTFVITMPIKGMEDKEGNRSLISAVPEADKKQKEDLGN